MRTGESKIDWVYFILKPRPWDRSPRGLADQLITKTTFIVILFQFYGPFLSVHSRVCIIEHQPLIADSRGLREDRRTVAP